MIRTHRRQALGLLAPYLLGAFLLVMLPAGISFALAFTHYNGIRPPVFAGWYNFTYLWREQLFRVAIINSLLFIVQAVPLRILAALGLALLYNRPRRGVGLYRAAAYLPTVIPDVAYALVWMWIFNPLYGPLNYILSFLGLPTQAWLVEQNSALKAIVFMSLFQIGEGLIILLAGLRHIPREYYEAAQMDGANRFQQFFSITLPLLSPWLILLSIRDIALSFQSTFTPAYIMTRGGPYYATYFAPLMIYEEAFYNLRFGIGTALMLIIFAVTLLLTLLAYFVFEGSNLDED
ncbi:MAG TPA: sugar ABC transporter permease [Anaerolineales bacterium]|nr:sugar ABC transporter permease [Anaerolineales bacterium]